MVEEDLLNRLKLIQAWKRPGGPTPKEKMPSIFKAVSEVLQILERPTISPAVRVNEDGSGWRG